jgi:FO synthase
MMTDHALRHFLLGAPLEALTEAARSVRAGRQLTYSRKVFIPLTQLCRDVCGYCTFAKLPRQLKEPYLSVDAALAIARLGAAAGCKEALFTLGDKPEFRYPAARRALEAMGFVSTIDYLEHVAARVLDETGLLPHINAGILSQEEYSRLRPVAPSMGLMLESTSKRLCERGGPHFGSPDKDPAVRLRTIADAGVAKIPFTSGILIGIGETREERIDALIALRNLHREYGHLQEIIVQNFRAKRATRMALAEEPTEAELLWTIAAARLVLDRAVAVQSPPNLNPGRIAAMIDAGLNDWGGISPVTKDHVNPETAWPDIDALAKDCAGQDATLAERLTVYPRYIAAADTWIAPAVAARVRRLADSEWHARDSEWSPGIAAPAPGSLSNPIGARLPAPRSDRTDLILATALSGRELAEEEIVELFAARGPAAEAVIQAADDLRRATSGDVVTYVVNRNINYTNICMFSCAFCAFSKSSSKGGTRDKPYDLEYSEIALRASEARDKGATEVCLQGGIHPHYTGDTYLAVLRAVKAAVPDMHVHAFSPLEVHHGAATLGVTARDFLARLRDAGLGSLPGTAAEILDDEIRARICPDKITTGQWLDIVGTAHRLGLPTTSTIMFGHIETPVHWARHLLALRRQQLETGGFTEFVPLPFVHMQAPVYLRGMARRGPTWRESVLMHAVSRIVLHGAIDSIQASWVKLGLDGAATCLSAGANDLGGVLMNESISRAAGASHGQEASAAAFSRALAGSGRSLRQRTTLYDDVDTLAGRKLALAPCDKNEVEFVTG